VPLAPFKPITHHHIVSFAAAQAVLFAHFNFELFYFWRGLQPDLKKFTTMFENEGEK